MVDKSSLLLPFQKALATLKLLSDSASWLLFIEKRNLTSHTYNSETANEVYQVIPKFVEEADRLFATLSNLKDI